MGDPYQNLMLRSRLTTVGALVMLAALLLAIGYFKFGIVQPAGALVQAEVLRLGTHPVARLAGGTLPIVTVRLPDGSVRQVQTSWADVEHCKPGSSLSLLQHGNALQVGRPGCALVP